VTTSGAFGHRVEKSLAFPGVGPYFAAPGSVFDVLIRRRARQRCLGRGFDPDNLRMRLRRWLWISQRGRGP